MDQVPLAQTAQSELSFHPLPGASSSVKQIPEMLLTPSRPQARDWETLAGVSPGGRGGRGKEARVTGRPLGSVPAQREAPHWRGRRPPPPRSLAPRCDVRRAPKLLGRVLRASQGPPRAAPRRPAPPRLQGRWRRVPRVCKPAPRARSKPRRLH